MMKLVISILTFFCFFHASVTVEEVVSQTSQYFIIAYSVFMNFSIQYPGEQKISRNLLFGLVF